MKKLIASLFAVLSISISSASLAFSVDIGDSSSFDLSLTNNPSMPVSMGIISYVSESYEGAMDVDYKYYATFGKITNDPIAAPAQRNVSFSDIEAGVRFNF